MEEYYDKCHYLDPSDLEHIMHPQALSPLQEEMMSHHCHLHHTPFPQMIVMAELGEIPKSTSTVTRLLPSLCLVFVWHCSQVSLEDQV
jgi:hypothetical protein